MRHILRGTGPNGLCSSLLLLVSLLCVSCGGGGQTTLPNGPVTPPPIDAGSTFVGSIQTVCSEDIAVDGDLLYVADGPAGVGVVDIGDRSNPILVTNIPTTYAFRIYIYEGHLYLCDASAGLKVFSLSTPSNPVLTFSEDTVWATSAAFKDGYLYIGDHFAGFRIYKLDDPGNPELVQTLATGRIRDLSFDGVTLLVSNDLKGLALYRLETPTVPIRTYLTGSGQSNFEDVVGHQNFAFVARNDESSALLAFYFGESTGVPLAWEERPSRFIAGLTRSEDLLIVSCGEDGLVGYDIANLPARSKRWEIETPGYARRAKKDGQFLYVADMSSVRIYDMSSIGGGPI